MALRHEGHLHRNLQRPPSERPVRRNNPLTKRNKRTEHDGGVPCRPTCKFAALPSKPPCPAAGHRVAMRSPAALSPPGAVPTGSGGVRPPGAGAEEVVNERVGCAALRWWGRLCGGDADHVLGRYRGGWPASEAPAVSGRVALGNGVASAVSMAEEGLWTGAGGDGGNGDVRESAAAEVPGG